MLFLNGDLYFACKGNVNNMQGRTNDFWAPGLTVAMGPSHVQRDRVHGRGPQLRRYQEDVINQLCHPHANSMTLILAKDNMVFLYYAIPHIILDFIHLKIWCPKRLGPLGTCPICPVVSAALIICH